MNDNEPVTTEDNNSEESTTVVEAAHRFGGNINNNMNNSQERTKLSPTTYEIRFRDNTTKQVTGYLGVSPLFVAVTDSNEKILFMLPHSDYIYVEAVQSAEAQEVS